MCSREDDPSFRDVNLMTEYEIRQYQPLGVCAFCGEAFFPNSERAEVVHKSKAGRSTINHLVVHDQCYLNHEDEYLLA